MYRKRVGIVEVIKVFNGVTTVKKGDYWNEFFAEVIDETLKEIFRDDGARVIYDFLENHSNLKLKDVADKPEVFSESLEKLMASAARVIEQAILKKWYSEQGIEFKNMKGFKFADHIRKMRNRI